MPEDKLAPTVKMGSFIKKVGIQGTRDAAKTALAEVKPETVANRYAIGFDDSGSMSGQPLSDAKKAVSGFLASCNPLDTSVAIFPFGAEPKPLSNLFDVVTAYTNGIKLAGSTPLYTTLTRMLEESDLTRGILFSDGEPTDEHDLYRIEEHPKGDSKYDMTNVDLAAVNMARDKKIPIDTVFIGYGESKVLKYIAEATGGYYLKFDDTTSFAKNMKYLSPKYVALLANAEIKEKIQRGETI